MNLPIVFRRQARYEFDDAADWYDERRPGLGARFVAEVQAVLNRIIANPQRYAMVFADVREGLLHTFPYAVYYRVEESRIVVLAIFHASRDPEIWQSRAMERDER